MGFENLAALDGVTAFEGWQPGGQRIGRGLLGGREGFQRGLDLGLLALGCSFEKFEPVPEPYLKTRASRTQRSMMPPSLTRSSSTDWIKQACGAGRSYALVERFSSPERGSQYQWP
jgi:hypothetical protein